MSEARAPTPDRFALRSQRVVTPEGVRPATVVWAGEHIEAVLANTDHALDEDLAIEDLGAHVLMAGLVDCHVHINEPGRTEWEGFTSATRAAAAGGVTTVVDMPLNCLPVTTTVAALEHKLAVCSGQLQVDVGFWGGVVPDNIGDLAALAERGVLGCKAFLVHSGIDEFPNATEADLRAAMPILRDAGIPLLAHAELDLGAEVQTDDPRAYQSYLESRPARWEDEAIALLIRLCRETGCRVHIVHLSSADSLPQLRAARDEGLPITVETCPHYLCLEAESIPDGATEFKCAPPIRDADNRERLWQGLADGIIDFVITDHSPCLPGLKLPEEGDFHRAWGGISSLQLGLPNLWTHARERGFSIADIARWLTSAPARFAGLDQRKGRIAAGWDADLVIWDPDARFDVEAAGLHFRHPISPYIGQSLAGVVQRTYVRGTRVFQRDAEGPRFADGRIGRPVLRHDSARKGSTS